MEKESVLSQTCPHCGVPLPPEAVFCPYCARSINRRTEPKMPKPVWGKAMRMVFVLFAFSAVILGVFLYNQPRVYDSGETAEVLYTDEDGTYQLVMAWPRNRYEPIYEIHQRAELDGEYRFPTRLYINHVDSGIDAGLAFMRKVAWSSAEFIQSKDNPSPWTCTQPAPQDASPGAALVSYINFTGRSTEGILVLTLQMKNGDTIRLRQKMVADLIPTYYYYPDDTPMDTLEALQALVDEIAQTIEPEAVVNVYLPAVTYEGVLVMEQRPVNLWGNTEGEGRTVFTDSIRVASKNSWITYIYDIDFVGNGNGVGVSSSARTWIENCNFTGWKTAVLGYGDAWVNVIKCSFEDNHVGFHFNSEGNSVSHTQFNENLFLNNDTAVLLECVPTDVTLNFWGSIFSGNELDIDNQCHQSLDISEAVFQ